MNFDDDETGLALMALERVYAEAKRQLSEGHSGGCGGAAWFCTRRCKAQIEVLIARIEQHQKDQAEEKADGA